MPTYSFNSKGFRQSKVLELNETWLKSKGKARSFYFTGGMTNFYSFIPWNYNMNRNNMLENPLLYARLNLQVVYC